MSSNRGSERAEGVRTFSPLAVSDIWGLIVLVGGIVDVIPELELIACIQRPQLSSRIGFQPIRSHPSVAVGTTVECQGCIP